jgi:hypothetical protein
VKLVLLEDHGTEISLGNGRASVLTRRPDQGPRRFDQRCIRWGMHAVDDVRGPHLLVQWCAGDWRTL